MPQTTRPTASTLIRLMFVIIILALIFAPGKKMSLIGLSELKVEAANKDAAPVADRSSSLIYTATPASAGQENRLTLRLNGDDVVLTNESEAVLTSRPLAETREVVVNGSAGRDALVA